jgi:tryptophan-rich sensory protein
MNARRATAMTSALACAGWISFSMAAAAAAFLWPVDGWYASIAKPSWNPPNWIFGPVWTTLYILIGVSAWRVWRTGAFGRDRTTLALFLVQWAFNFAWSGCFFGMRSPGLALIEIACLWALIAVLIARFWRHDRAAAMLLVPYLLWVSFATALNAAIWWLNA